MLCYMAGIGGFMPRSRSRGGWQMRGGRCVTNSTRPAMEAAGADQGIFVNNLVNTLQPEHELLFMWINSVKLASFLLPDVGV